MKVNEVVVKTINLELNEQEALWLKNQMQNPTCHYNDELEDDKKMREELFLSLGGKFYGDNA